MFKNYKNKRNRKKTVRKEVMKEMGVTKLDLMRSMELNWEFAMRCSEMIGA